MPKEGIEQKLIAALEAEAAERGVDIVDVEVVGATKSPCVRVRIDYVEEDEPTITLDEVAEETGWISDVIDDVDPFPGSFTLEVSSPGLSRPLRRPHDFERFAGERVSLSSTAYEGRKRYTGTLLGIDGTTVRLDCDGEEFAFDLDQIEKCTIKPDLSADFSESGKAKSQKN